MAISTEERVGGLFSIMRSAVENGLAQTWTATPGIIEEFDDDEITASVQPAIKGVVTAADGTSSAENLPLLIHCPVVFQRGGGVTMTFPVKRGDECLVVFSSRCIDAWWQSGGIQIPIDMRMHDLSDGFAIVGPQSLPNRIRGVSTDSAQLRSDDGATYIDLNPTSQKIKIVAPGGFDVVAPKSTFSAEVLVSGLFTFAAGMVGSAASGAAAVITGTFRFIGQVFANGRRIDDSHTHKENGTGSYTDPPKG